MRFRLRLALFLVATLVAVQVLTAMLLYGVTRSALILEGERQLGAAAQAFSRQLDELSQRVADNVQVLALDYPLRAAIAERDHETVLSALRNHGRRVGAERMLLLGLDGTIEADTEAAVPPATPQRFGFDDLIDAAYERRAAAATAIGNKAYWIVVVPVNAPQPIALIAAAIPIDDALLAGLQQLSALPHAIELFARSEDGNWRVVAHGREPLAIAPHVGRGQDLPQVPKLLELNDHEYVVHAVRLSESRRSAPLAAVLSHSLDDALRPYRPVAAALGALLAIGLVVGIGGAFLIARGVSRPVEALAAAARRIEAGDYTPPPPVRGAGEIADLAAALTNMAQAIAEREERIRIQAEHDAVTGLPNRIAAEAAIQRRLAGGGALLMIGVARVPDIVKTLGHAIADRLMHDAAERLRRIAADRLAARAAEHQFLLWSSSGGRAEAIALAFAVRDVLGEPYQETEIALDLAPAVGIALCPEHGTRADELLRHADVALFAALGSEEPVVVYDHSIDPHRPERLALLGDLREAIDRNELELHYQPKLDLASNRVDGAEGLLRWHHARLGPLQPDSFIALAESSGNIRRLTRWTLAAGVAQAQRWNANGHTMRVAINLSARDLDDPDLPRRVSELLAVHAVRPERILLEITESAVMGEPGTSIAVLKRLSDQGIDIAIDDFGVGQSSLAYLRRLPVREIKIDKSFVQKLAVDAEDRAIVRTIVELGHRLGYRVTAEGVEDAPTLEYLRTIECDHAQGYYISRPLPVSEFDAYIAAARHPSPDVLELRRGR